MKQILLILLTCFSLTSFCQPLMGIIASSQNNAITTNYLYGNIMAESFEGTGYQTATWTETIGTNSGCLVNEDNTDVTITGGGSQVLKIVKVITPTATTAGSYGRALYSFGSEYTTTYTDCYVQVNAQALATSATVTLLVLKDGANAVVSNISLINSAGNLRLYAQMYNNGAYVNNSYPTSGAISLNTWYHLQIKYDVPNLLCSITINGTSVYSAAITGTHYSGIKSWMLGDNTSVQSLTAYWDLLNVSSTTFFVP